ncbi:hypothetical protein FNU79_17730 [Deinococcus detaillensis]|uniref:Uncharacterized protein n=1 Tax=Deinococcus detaillensis TaxID=2592048 RepID=A0A553UHM6_9DEIO|nr:hypothetical protein [Deinococcus detaillensis]TSA79531.1 hypothetical protein FNU79_17730 [Deinococcus detaillensis]
MHSLLTEVLDRARAAVLSNAAQLPTAPQQLTKWQTQTRTENAARAAPLLSLRPTEPPPPRMLASYPDATTVQAERTLTKGQARLWVILHRLAVDVGRERGYTATPHHVAYHCPALTIAGALGYTDRHIRTLAAGLERAGLLDCGGHAQQIGARSLYDGTLWGVLTVASSEPPRLRAEDWRHNWRPDFGDDVVGKTGAAAETSELLSKSAEPEEHYRAAKRRAAAPSASSAPLCPSSEQVNPASFRGVIDGIAALWRLHSSKRPRAVGALASQIAGALAEPERRRYWCQVLWQALTAQDAGAIGGLSALTAQFDRLAVDLRENAPWKSPGAILAARWKGAQ